MDDQTNTINQDGTLKGTNTKASGAETPSAPAFSERVKLDLSADEADMIQALLSNYVLAYRSDRSVDYKPEPVPREKVGQYPYVATPPAPEIINPAYDWINKEWYSKSNNDNLNDIAQTIAALKAKSNQYDQISNIMQGILLNLGGSKVTQPEASKADTQSTQPSDK